MSSELRSKEFLSWPLSKLTDCRLCAVSNRHASEIFITVYLKTGTLSTTQYKPMQNQMTRSAVRQLDRLEMMWKDAAVAYLELMFLNSQDSHSTRQEAKPGPLSLNCRAECFRDVTWTVLTKINDVSLQ
jgi:hypothetical protein